MTEVAATPSGVDRAAGAQRFDRTASSIGINASLSVLFILLALAVQMLFASRLGASRNMDIFFAVTGVAAALRNIICSSLPQSFVPVLKDLDRGVSPDAARRLAVGVSAGLLVLFGGLALAVIGAAPLVIALLVPGFDAPSQAIAAVVLRIVALAFVFDALRGLAISFFYARERFALPGLVPSFQHVALAAGIVLWYPRLGVQGLAWAWLLGSAGMLAGLLVAVPRGWTRVRVSAADVWRELARLTPAVPVLAVAALFEARMPLERVFASYLGEGAVSYLGYSNRILQTMYACLPMAIAVTYFPQFASHSARADDGALAGSFAEALRVNVLVIVPMVALCLTLSLPVVQVLFERGQFGAANAVAVSHTLVAHLGVLVGLGASSLAYNVFFARKSVRPLVALEAGCLALLAGLAALLAPRWGYVGVAVASSVVAIARGALSLAIVARHLGRFDLTKVTGSLRAALVGAAAATVAVASLERLLPLALGGPLRPVVSVSLLPAAGLAVYLLMLRAQRVPELDGAVSFVKARLQMERA